MSKESFAKVAAFSRSEGQGLPAMSASSESFELVEPSSTTNTSFSSVNLEPASVGLSQSSAVSSNFDSPPSERNTQSLESAVNSMHIDETVACLESKDENANHDDALHKADGAASESRTISSNSETSSRRPPSFDGKSIASGTTFALDEKESLRPDDSASVKAAEDEDLSLPGSRLGSETGAKAFREQLQDISERPKVLAHRGLIPSRVISPAAQSPGPQIGNTHQKEFVVDSGDIIPQGEATSNVLPFGITQQEPDEKLLEALETPKDRLFLLKLEQDVIEFVKDSKDPTLELPPCNSFCRLLIHKLADYYFLTHFVDSTNNSVHLYRTPYCRLPPPLTGISNPPTSGNTPPPNGPAMKIMRRGNSAKHKLSSIGNGSSNSEAPSKSGSETGEFPGVVLGEDGTNILLQENGALNAKEKGALTRAEREAKYKEARERIFKGFSEKTDGEDFNAEMEDTGNISRTSSQMGAKAKQQLRKQRNVNDDGFEARSQFAAYYPASEYKPPSAPPHYGVPGQPSFGYNQQINPQMSPMNQVGSPPLGVGGPPISPAQAFLPYATSQAHGPPNFPNLHGQSSFSSVPRTVHGSPSQPLAPAGFQQPSLSAPYTGGPQINFQPHQSYGQQPHPYHDQSSPRANSGIRQSPYQSPVPQYAHALDRTSYTPPSNAHDVPYAYGQLPGPNTGHGNRPRNNQHPIPGSFNRNVFNPHSQSFVPGANHIGSLNAPAFTPFQGSNGPPFQNGFPGVPAPTNGHRASFGQQPGFPSPYLTRPSNNNPSHGFQNYGSGPNNDSPHTTPKSDQKYTPSTLPKWGAPSNLPPKPPAPASFSHHTQPYASALKGTLPGQAPARPNAVGMPSMQPFPGTPIERKDI
ncbi:MAG: hypothetical protein M4579_004572 [Chaenotheca gracillima]|nr:MAG: hypothetical protein M4579_004572 [Chaenotheca gracillima]